MSGYRSKFKRLVDPQTVRARRFELGVAERALGDALGVESAVIRRLERGHSQDQLTAAFVVDLAEALMVPVHQLLAREERPAEPAPNDDAEAVGAVLARADEPVHVDRLTDELGWTVDRVDAALEVLDARLVAVGQTLGWLGDSLVAVAHRADEETTRIAAALVSDSVTSDGLTVTDAKLLWAAATQHERTSRANALPAPNLRKLEAAGLITTEPEGSWERGSGVHLTELARTALRWEPGDG
jgi:transcriptional regulator with XRE-family HTH domain